MVVSCAYNWSSGVLFHTYAIFTDYGNVMSTRDFERRLILRCYYLIFDSPKLLDVMKKKAIKDTSHVILSKGLDKAFH